VVEVATAVPAFIGYTEMAVNGGKSLKNRPWRITSLAEYHRFFGGAPSPVFSISEYSQGGSDEGSENALPIVSEPDIMLKGKGYSIKDNGSGFLLYYSMMMFFQNGGGSCYIVSVGDYSEKIDGEKLMSGIGELIKEQEPTMVVIPEAVRLSSENCIAVQQAALDHCGAKMKNRITILDIHNGFLSRQDPAGDCIENFRGALGINYLDFATAYYPWVNTTIVHEKDLGYENFEKKALQTLLIDELDLNSDLTDPRKAQLAEAVNGINDDNLDPNGRSILNKTLIQISPLFNMIIKESCRKLNLLPVSSAMAGVFTMVDNSKGVWKAPANVSLNSVISPAVNITHDDQEDLNVNIHGKSINAIRSFIGEGVLVWGARTLDGNSLDWRYINVRRTMLMLEESVKLATKAYVFENNVANTWVTIKSMISNFLTGIWKRGGLAGSSPDDAFSVHVGLGETMTPEDVLEGILRVTVLVALIRPAEFIEITFQQQMQKS
jgi:phage tail sheath protein FI